MATLGFERSEYTDRSTGDALLGDTTRRESRLDTEHFLIPQLQAIGSGLHLWGVASGLTVSAVRDQPGVTVSPGIALDAAGRLLSLAQGAAAVTDPQVSVDPAVVVDVPVVAVPASGVLLTTGTITGDRLVVMRSKEAQKENLDGSEVRLVHAPLLRLVVVDGFADDGTSVVLGRVSLTAGKVSKLAAGLRRTAGIPVGAIEFRRIRDTGTAVDQVTAVRMGPRADGIVEIRDDFSVAGDLSVDGVANFANDVEIDGGELRAGSTVADELFVKGPAEMVRASIGTRENKRTLHVEGSEVHSGGNGGGFSFADRHFGGLQENPGAGERWVWYADAGTARLWSGSDKLSVSPAGHVAIGLDARNASRPLQVEGPAEVHSGGTGGGFSFADRRVEHLVDSPDAGERWVWYGLDGTARLWSGGDIVSVHPMGGVFTLDVAQRMRVRQEGSDSAGIWFHQDNGAERAFVGMSDDTHVGFWGNNGAQWGLTMETRVGRVDIKTTGAANFAALRCNGSIGLIATGAPEAGRFIGDVNISGALTKGVDNFKIDHPLDPEHKYLSHAAVESNEMKNIYDGCVQADADGAATITLPDWFEALNEDFRYQLTALGDGAPGLHVARELRAGSFTIAGAAPGMRVCWQVTGNRHDAFAIARPLEVETDKRTHEAGRYLYPEAHGAPLAQAIGLLEADSSDYRPEEDGAQ